MEIYLDHPYNGATVVYNPADADRLVKQGWVIRHGDSPEVARKKAVLAAAAAQAAEPVVPVDDAPKPRRRV